MNYEGFTGEELAMLSFDDDDAWDSVADTPPKHDMGKVSHLSAEDRKDINALEANAPSCKAKVIWLCFSFVWKGANSFNFNIFSLYCRFFVCSLRGNCD